FHATVQHCDIQIRKYFLAQLAIHFHRGFEFRLFVFFDDWIDNIRLMSRGRLLSNELPNLVCAFIANPAGDDWSPSRRHLVENADVEVAVESERKGSGDWGRRHI